MVKKMLRDTAIVAAVVVKINEVYNFHIFNELSSFQMQRLVVNKNVKGLQTQSHTVDLNIA